MKFIQTIKDSIYGPGLYKKVAAGAVPFGTSVRYLLKLLALATLVSWVMLASVAGGFLYFGAKVIGPQLIKQYPADLEVSVKNGEVSTNVASPYKIPMPTDKSRSDDKKSIDNVLVIDIVNEPTYAKFDEYKTLALIGKKTAWYKNDSGQVTIVSLEKFPNVTINKMLVDLWYPKVSMFLKGAFGVFIVVLFPIIYAGLIIYYLIYLLLAALLVFCLLKILKVPANYSRSYQLAIHAVTLTVVVGAVAFFLPMAKFPFLGTLILLAVVAINLQKK